MTPEEELAAIKETRRLVDEAQAMRARAWEKVQLGHPGASFEHDTAVRAVQRYQAALDSITRNVR